MSEHAQEGGTPTTPEGAAQALFEAVQADGGREAPATPGPGAQQGAPALTAFDVHAPGNQPPTQPAPTVDPPGTPATQTAEEAEAERLLSKDIDLGHLDPAARDWLTAREKEMQAVMTRRTQEAAELQKQYEGLDPATAREALGFYEGIRTDPNYAAEVYDLLTQNLIAAGYEPARAAYEAANRVGEQQQTTQTPPVVDDDDPDSAIQARLDMIDRRQQEIDQQFQAAQLQRVEDELASRILAQENAIRQARPDLKDEHIDYIYDLAPDGNLMAGYEKFNTMATQLAQEYWERKAAVPDAATPPAATPVGRPPLDFHDAAGNPSVDLAHAAALRTLQEDMKSQ